MQRNKNKREVLPFNEIKLWMEQAGKIACAVHNALNADVLSIMAEEDHIIAMGAGTDIVP